jgi:DNA/RNA endonuclease YhcR with UshA esterase domain
MVEYDITKPVTIKGIVRKIEYENPHISFFIDVKDADGRVTSWGFEAASPTALRAQGWTRNSIKPGDYVTVDAYRARNGTPFGAARTLTLPNGRQLSAASDGVPPVNK